jgi:hypothetical protein
VNESLTVVVSSATSVAMAVICSRIAAREAWSSSAERACAPNSHTCATPLA